MKTQQQMMIMIVIRGWLQVNSRAWCLVWQRIAGRVGLGATWQTLHREPMSAEAGVDTACVNETVWHFSAQDMPVQWVRGKEILDWVCAQWVDVIWAACWHWWGFVFNACMYVLFEYAELNKQHVPLTCDTRVIPGGNRNDPGSVSVI